MKSRAIFTNMSKKPSADISADLRTLHSVLFEVRRVLSAAIHAWDRFAGVDGELSFFADLQDHNTTLVVQEIRAHFDEMQLLEAKVDTLDALCEDCAKSASLQSLGF
jgi:hypothetical protein